MFNKKFYEERDVLEYLLDIHNIDYERYIAKSRSHYYNLFYKKEHLIRIRFSDHYCHHSFIEEADDKVTIIDNSCYYYININRIFEIINKIIFNKNEKIANYFNI